MKILAVLAQKNCGYDSQKGDRSYATTAFENQKVGLTGDYPLLRKFLAACHMTGAVFETQMSRWHMTGPVFKFPNQGWQMPTPVLQF